MTRHGTRCALGEVPSSRSGALDIAAGRGPARSVGAPHVPAGRPVCALRQSQSRVVVPRRPGRGRRGWVGLYWPGSPWRSPTGPAASGTGVSAVTSGDVRRPGCSWDPCWSSSCATLQSARRCGPGSRSPTTTSMSSGTGGRPVDGPDERRGRGPAHDGGRTRRSAPAPGPRGEPGPGRGVLRLQTGGIGFHDNGSRTFPDGPPFGPGPFTPSSELGGAWFEP